jgi:hypothetical protein
VVLRARERDRRSPPLVGDTLAFRCYADTEITEANSPRISMQDSAGLGSASLTLVTGRERIPAGLAVGFLEDGSMVVVNEARAYLGRNVRVEIVSVLPTAAGKMIFARLVGAA